jgi:hypothetical protein
LHFDLKFSDLRKLWQPAQKSGNRRHALVMTDLDKKPRSSRLFACLPQCQKRGKHRLASFASFGSLTPLKTSVLSLLRVKSEAHFFGWLKAVKVS